MTLDRTFEVLLSTTVLRCTVCSLRSYVTGLNRLGVVFGWTRCNIGTDYTADPYVMQGFSVFMYLWLVPPDSWGCTSVCSVMVGAAINQ